MPLDFEPRTGSAIDLESGIVIYAPRMLPASPPEDPGRAEYQYAFYRGDDRIYGLGLFGSDMTVDKAGRRERVFTLDLARGQVLEMVFEFKRILENEDDDFVFLAGLARGLVAVFGNRPDDDADMRYVAVTDAALLAERGIRIPESVLQSVGDGIVLAETLVPARVVVGEGP